MCVCVLMCVPIWLRVGVQHTRARTRNHIAAAQLKVLSAIDSSQVSALGLHALGGSCNKDATSLSFETRVSLNGSVHSRQSERPKKVTMSHTAKAPPGAVPGHTWPERPRTGAKGWVSWFRQRSGVMA